MPELWLLECESGEEGDGKGRWNKRLVWRCEDEEVLALTGIVELVFRFLGCVFFFSIINYLIHA